MNDLVGGAGAKNRRSPPAGAEGDMVELGAFARHEDCTARCATCRNFREAIRKDAPGRAAKAATLKRPRQGSETVRRPICRLSSHGSIGVLCGGRVRATTARALVWHADPMARAGGAKFLGLPNEEGWLIYTEASAALAGTAPTT